MFMELGRGGGVVGRGDNGSLSFRSDKSHFEVKITDTHIL